MSTAAPRRAVRLAFYLILASAVSIAAVAAECLLGLVSLRRSSEMTEQALSGQIAFLNDASAFEMLLYQKGFVTEYLLTGDRGRLAKLEEGRRAFDGWFARARAWKPSPEARRILGRIADEYAAYDERRGRVVALAESGRASEAHALLKENQPHMDQLVALFQEFGQLGRSEAELSLQRAQQAMRRRTWLLLLASLAGAVASLAVGFLLARRIGRPIYELQLQIESAAERTRIALRPGREGLDALGEQVGALVRKLEETDAAIVEQRRRLLQSEKLSAVGELSAKLAHEILNPLAGIKAAVQLLLRRPEAPPGTAVQETAMALDREVDRIDQLVRRLVQYARPLQPRVEVCGLSRLFDEALGAARPVLERASVEVERREDGDLPPLEIDRLLMTQVLTNLLANAAQARAGGRVRISANRVSHLGRDHVCIRVTDEGPGIAAEHLGQLFHPFFTTKPQGNGLGLAVSQNIVMEHGGQLVGRNRDPGPGAVFEVLLPVLR